MVLYYLIILMTDDIIYAKGEGSIIKLQSIKRAHYIPMAIIDSDVFKIHFKTGVRNIVELHDGYIVIRPKVK